MKICFCLHNHQPVGNFDHIIDSAYLDCYLPMLEVLENHHRIKCGIHFSGTLLEWLAQNHPEYLERAAELCRDGRMELLTSGRYEPILTIFRKSDIVQQIRDYSEHLTQYSGTRPKGLWLTERVWEPHLPSVLCKAGVTWAVVDDIHLKRAGVSGSNLFRPCITEDSGRILKLLGSNRELRYRIPFSPVECVLEMLREMHDSGAEVAFYGDDGEKFGVWPGTHDLCFKDHWLDRFFSEIESADWIDSVLPSEAAEIDAAGPIFVPASSYAEMGEWTLHGRFREEYDQLREQLAAQNKLFASEVLLAGGFWRNFLSIYPESKELQGRIISAEPLVRRSEDVMTLHHFWRSQCNCAFWHGVFGGIYLPHLREAVWKELHKAEWNALRIVQEFPLLLSADINADGRDENVIISENMSLLIHPERGLTVSEFAFFHSDGEPVPLGHVLSRQLEEYHKSIPGTGSSAGTGTIHDDMVSKEEGLAGKVTVDRWRRMCFTDLVMSSSLAINSWSQNAAEISQFQKSSLSSSKVVSNSEVIYSAEFAEDGMSVSKEMTVSLNSPEIRTCSEYSIRPGDRSGMEICLNLMTGQSHDRYYSVDSGEKHIMSAAGEYYGRRIEVIDCWRSVRVIIESNAAAHIWITPLDSVNRSESGYESVHQGTAFFISDCTDEAGFLRMEISIRLEAYDGE